MSTIEEKRTEENMVEEYRGGEEGVFEMTARSVGMHAGTNWRSKNV